MRVSLALAAAVGCSGGSPARGLVAGPPEGPAARPPARPAGCVEVSPGTPLQERLDRSPDGAAVCLLPGVYPGPVLVSRGQRLFGPRAAILRSGGQGTTVRLAGTGAQLLGVTVDGSGGRYDLLDAGVQAKGQDLLVQGVRVQRAMYGIVVDRSVRVGLRDNEVVGTGEAALGLRGDGLRLWETHDSVIEGNRVWGGRDVVIRYSHRNRLRGNTVRGGRYGLHLMYSHDNEISHNRSVHNVVGTFLMYSRNVRMVYNLLAASSGAAGIGLGVKESGNLTIEDNVLVGNTVGVYLDTSPLYLHDANTFTRNAIRLSDVGVTFHSSLRRNTFRDNSLRDNHRQVRVEGGGDALGVTWVGNDFDDYVGYDLDRDGVGDVPYQLISLSSQLTSRYPDLLFFRGAPALALVDAVSHILPLFQPRTLLVDQRPRMRELLVEVPRAD